MSATIVGFFTPLAVYVVVLALHLVVPARHVVGYVSDEATGEPLRYRLNGIVVLLLSVALWAALGWAAILPWDYLWRARWESLGGAVPAPQQRTDASSRTAQVWYEASVERYHRREAGDGRGYAIVRYVAAASPRIGQRLERDEIHSAASAPSNAAPAWSSASSSMAPKRTSSSRS